jgi:hypothetical protein
MNIDLVYGNYLNWLNDSELNKYLNVRFFQPYTANMDVDFTVADIIKEKVEVKIKGIFNG